MVRKLGGTSIIGAALVVSALIVGRGAVAATFTYNDDPVPGGMCGCGSCNCIMIPIEEAQVTATSRTKLLLSLLSKKQLASVADLQDIHDKQETATVKAQTSSASAATTKTTAISSGSTVTKTAASASTQSTSKTTSSAPTQSLVSSSGSGSSGSSGGSKSTSAASAGASVTGSAASKTTTSNANTSTSKLQDIHDSKESAQVKATGVTESLVSGGGTSAASKGSTATKATNSSGSPDDRSSNSSLVSGGSSAASSGGGTKSSTQTLQDIQDKRDAAIIKAQGLPQDTSTGKTSGSYNYNSESGRVRVADNNTDYRSLFVDTSKANFVAPEVNKSSYSPEYFKGEDWRLIGDPTKKGSSGKSTVVAVPIIIVEDYTVEKAVSVAQKRTNDDGMYYEYNKPDGSKGYVNSKGFLVGDPTK